MKLHLLDVLIIVAYIVATLVLGFWIAKRASKSLKSYFLGGNEMPWLILGISNASGMFDISGTMLLVYWLFVYGLKSIWIPWVWPVFNQIFLMVYLSTWLRRSGVMTGAEWIRFRFGDGEGARLAHMVVVIFAIVNVIGFLAYGFIGIGKFAAAFLPWRLAADDAHNVEYWGLLITAITTLYVVKGGMFSVVFTEILQYVLKTIAGIAIGIIAMALVTPDMLHRFIPAGWTNQFFGWHLNLDWGKVLPAVNDRILGDGWSIFGFFVLMTAWKGILLSMAGPAPNYDMQRVLSTKTPREAAKMSGVVTVVLMFPRYMLVAGLTVLALAFYSPTIQGLGKKADFELILPWAAQHYVPTGLLGLLIAGLLAAFMSTYSATVNAAPAYIVNDIYKRYINPHASEKTYVRWSYVVSIIVVILGTVIGLYVGSLNKIVQWLVTALFGAYTASNVLKWYWWRFNAHGYFWGMVGGIGAALVFGAFADQLAALAGVTSVNAILSFPVILAVSLIGCFAGSLLTPPDDEEVLKRFYLKVRPWGFWKPIHDKLKLEHPALVANRDFKRDMFNVVVGTIWQTAFVAGGIYIVLRSWTELAICGTIVIVTSAILKYNWLNKMVDYPPDLAEYEAAHAQRAAVAAPTPAPAR